MAYFEKGRTVTQPAPPAGDSAPPRREPAGAGGSNAFTRKLGPLPVWGWMGIGLAIALVYYFWKQNKKTAATASPTSTPDQTTAASQIPQFINEVNEATPITENISNSNSNTQTVSTPPASTGGSTGTGGGGGHPPPKPNPKYITVTVGKFPSGSGGSPSAQQNSFGPGTAAWNSTLWGIATHYNVKGGYQTLAQLNHIANPNLIYPGQKILVPT